MVFVDAPILGERPECFDCRVKLARRPPAPGPRRYENEEERIEARRRAWRESKQRKVAAA